MNMPVPTVPDMPARPQPVRPIDIQQRHQPVFRIRFGEKKGNRPVKLTDAIRITSRNRLAVEAFAHTYGGEPRPWNNGGKPEHEVYIPVTEIRVVLIPGQSVSTWWELWKGSVCERRCDSVTNTKGGACVCLARDPEERTKAPGQCNPVTRVSVIAPDVKVLGTGMFISNGLIAAETLPQSIDIANAALAQGLFVPATLRIVEHKGRNHFVVPQIETVGVSMVQMLEAASTGQAAIGSATDRVLGGVHPRFTPIAELEGPDANTPPVGEQLAEQAARPAAAPRRNAATPIPSTGARPRTAAEAGADQDVIDVPGDEDDSPAPARTVNRVAIAAREAELDDDGRHDLCSWASEGRTRSSKELDENEVAAAVDACRKVKAGSHRFVADEGSPSGFKLVSANFGWETPPDPGAHAPVDAGVLTVDQVMAMKGPVLNAALKERSLPLGGTVPEMRDRLLVALNLGTEVM